MARHTTPPGRQPPVTASTSRDRDPGARCCCEGRGDGRGTCASCGQRRGRVWKLVVVNGMSHEEAAERMELTPEGVRRLIHLEADRRDLKRHKCNQIECEQLSAFVVHALEHDGLSITELAHFLDMALVDLKRQLGMLPRKNGRTQRHVDVATASRIVVALGRAPHELEGC